MPKKETIIVFSAHSDDFVIGAGGTIANYTQQGQNVAVVVFSYGESSHPWLKQEVVKKMRAEETLQASQLLHCQVTFFDLKEFNFKKEYQANNLKLKLIKMFNQLKPTKIFTHSHEDPHPDHSAVNLITMELVQSLSYKPEVYIYSVWNPVSFRTKYPSLCSDISNTFSSKLKALSLFKSQKFHLIYPFILLIFRAVIDGFKIKKWFGEKFYRIT